eukprot:3632027-Rhodomonas_salina.1
MYGDRGASSAHGSAAVSIPGHGLMVEGVGQQEVVIGQTELVQSGLGRASGAAPATDTSLCSVSVFHFSTDHQCHRIGDMAYHRRPGLPMGGGAADTAGTLVAGPADPDPGTPPGQHGGSSRTGAGSLSRTGEDSVGRGYDLGIGGSQDGALDCQRAAHAAGMVRCSVFSPQGCLQPGGSRAPLAGLGLDGG